MRSLKNLVERTSPLGFTPLISVASGEVLKYDFKGVGPVVIDKSGPPVNNGKLKPNWPTNTPRRRLVSILPPTAELVLDGDDDYVLVPDDPSLDISRMTVSLDFTRRTVADEGITTLVGKFQDNNNYWIIWLRRADHGNAEISFTTEVDGERSSVGTGRRITPGRYAVDCEFDGSELAMYLNDEEVDRSPGKLATYDADVYIGSQRGGRFAHCNFRKVSIYDRAVHA